VKFVDWFPVMLQTIIVLGSIAIIIALIWTTPLLKKLKRQTLKNRPFPWYWLSILEQNVPIYKRLPKALQKRLQGHIQVFLAEKQFIGCGGLKITEEIKLTIAAQACLLLLNETGNYFSSLVSILVYPSAYVVKATKTLGDRFLEEKEEVRLGESWQRGQVVLSWENIQYDMNAWQDGHNVILHEFAHQLDQEDGRADGVPLLEKRTDYQRWARVFSDEYQRLCYQVERGFKTDIDRYGATNAAEFFAVVTEYFFEQPQQILKNHPDLYHVLKYYYKLDPIEYKI
jgi:Mlc titration factor MtfA (ptsG expression regulator)